MKTQTLFLRLPEPIFFIILGYLDRGEKAHFHGALAYIREPLIKKILKTQTLL